MQYQPFGLKEPAPVHTSTKIKNHFIILLPLIPFSQFSQLMFLYCIKPMEMWGEYQRNLRRCIAHGIIDEWLTFLKLSYHRECRSGTTWNMWHQWTVIQRINLDSVLTNLPATMTSKPGRLKTVDGISQWIVCNQSEFCVQSYRYAAEPDDETMNCHPHLRNLVCQNPFNNRSHLKLNVYLSMLNFE